jgi:hypothetical protein
MASLVFGTIGNAIVPGIGGSIGGLVGSGVDSLLTNSMRSRSARQPGINVTFGQRVEDVYLSGSSEGAPIRKLWGRMRLGGNVIWCSQFKEWIETRYGFGQSTGGGKGGGGGGFLTITSVDYVYHYNLSFAVAFCEGGVGTSLGRVWADGKELDLSLYTWRFYDGSDQQLPDAHIEAIEGAGNVPAYRGICYLLFENMVLDKFGNRMPQISAEIIRRPIISDPDDLSNSLHSVCLIPGAGEFIYGSQVYKASDGYGNWNPQNANADDQRADLIISLDQLAGANEPPVPPPPIPPLGLPWSGNPDPPTGGNWTASTGALNAADAVSLVVTWFGTDLRAGNCQIVPKVETPAKETTPADWEVAGFTRAGYAWFVWFTPFGWGLPILQRVPYGSPFSFPWPHGTPAPVVSQIDPSLLDPNGVGASVSSGGGWVPALGGTPSDNTVVEAIAEIKRRGLRCVFYPFVMMDIPPGNGLPDPYGGTQQAAFPWRGRITCYPAPGQPGTVDKTSVAETQVNAFFAQYNPFVLHYANLCVQAGGVDAFIIGSELVGLTRLRSSAGDGIYPAVQALKSLAAQVRAIVGPSCKIGYAADWSEYHSHRPSDGTNDLIFNMDPLWSDPNIDFIGIDNYLPISDWRDVGPNVDEDPVNGPFSIYDKSYLQANVEGGEYFAWYYASDADRATQTRTPITDGAYGKPWVYRNKDIRSWWLNAHYSRPGGVEDASQTSFVPGSKPIWFTEFGCPAIDKGPNQPNVFVDPKSSESNYPYFSNGSRDDVIQRAYLEATLSYWRDHAPTSLAGVKMVEPRNMFAWCWDARPFPDYPAKSATWRDAPNYELGHWLTGRASEIPLRWIPQELCAAVGLTDYDVSGLTGAYSLVLGYAADGIVSPRDVLAGIEDAYQFDAFESGGKVVFSSRANVRILAIGSDDIAIEDAGDVGYSLTRAQETDLPGSLRLSFVDVYANYATGSASARKAVGNSDNVAQFSVAAVLEPAHASAIAQMPLQQAWAARESGEVKLPPSRIAIDPGDCIRLSVEGVTLPMRVRSIDSGVLRTATLVGFDPSLSRAAALIGERRAAPPAQTHGVPIVEFLDIPLLPNDASAPWAPRIAAYASPWSGVSVYRNNGAGWSLAAYVGGPSAIGELVSPLYAGPVDRWDDGNALNVKFYGAAQALSLTDSQVLGGAGALAIKNAALSEWEILQFGTAQLVAANQYRLTHLLRGQLGSEGAMMNPFPAGARVVFLDASMLGVLDLTSDQRNVTQTLLYGPSAYDKADPSYVGSDFAFKGIGLRPYSVSQIDGVRAPAAADVTFSWMRRTRFGGDNFDQPDVPLNEESESYDLEIMSDASVVRTVSGLTSPSWIYSAAQQAADFGAPQPAYTLNIYQNSASFGRGQVATKTVVL